MSLLSLRPDPLASMPIQELMMLRQEIESLVHPEQAGLLGGGMPGLGTPGFGTPGFGNPGLGADSFSLGGPSLNQFASPCSAPPPCSLGGGDPFAGAGADQLLPALLQALQPSGSLGGLGQSPCALSGALSAQPWQNTFPTNWGGASALGGIGARLPADQAGAQALAFSAAQMNPATANAINPNNGLSAGASPKAWNDWCLAFVSSAYGHRVPELNAATALDAYKNLAAEGRIQQGTNVPAGAPVFFDSQPWGHVAIATGKTLPNGDPIIRSTGWPGQDGIFEVPLSQLVAMTHSHYLGFAAI